MPVWITIDRIRLAGGTLKELPAAPCVIPAGTPSSLSKMGGEVTHFKTYRAKSLSSTTLELYPCSSWAMPKVNDYIALAPATADAAIQGIKITKVEPQEDGTIKLTTASEVTGAKDGSIIVEATSGNVAIDFKITGLSWHDSRIKEGDFAQTVNVVTSGTVLEDRIPPIPDFMKAALPMITFEKEV